MKQIGQQQIQDARKANNQFLKDIAPFRSELFRFCRSLTNNPWDAEDLVQETLIKAYGRMGDRHPGISNPKGYLFRIASNQWIDWCRRAQIPMNSTEGDPDRAYVMGCVYDTKESISAVLHYLPAKERVAFVLKEAFDYTLEEIAEVLGSTVGAVKSALHRARAKTSRISTQTTVAATDSSQQKVVEAAVAAFNKRDLKAVTSLFLSNASGNCYGCFLEMNAEEIERGSMFFTINSPDGKPIPPPYHAECRIIFGEPLFTIWRDDETLEDVFRLQMDGSKIARFDAYYCCPHVLAEIAANLGVKYSTHGYYYEEGLVSS